MAYRWKIDPSFVCVCVRMGWGNSVLLRTKAASDAGKAKF